MTQAARVSHFAFCLLNTVDLQPDLDPSAELCIPKEIIKTCHKTRCRAAARANSSCLGHVTKRPPQREWAISWLISPNISLIEDSAIEAYQLETNTLIHTHICTLFTHEKRAYTPCTHTCLTFIPCCSAFLSASLTPPPPPSPPSVAKWNSLTQQTKKPVLMYCLTSSSC